MGQGLEESPIDNRTAFWICGPGVATATVSGGVQAPGHRDAATPIERREKGEGKMMEIKVPMRVSEMLKTTVENRHKEKLGTIQDFMVGGGWAPKIRHPVSRGFPGNR